MIESKIQINEQRGNPLINSRNNQTADLTEQYCTKVTENAKRSTLIFTLHQESKVRSMRPGNEVSARIRRHKHKSLKFKNISTKNINK